MFAHIDAITVSCAVISGLILALAGALPALFLNELDASSGSEKKKLLSLLLNFAVGSLLSDIFLHLLPDIWRHTVASNSYYQQCLILLAGFFFCVFVERLFNGEPEGGDDDDSSVQASSLVLETDHCIDKIKGSRTNVSGSEQNGSAKTSNIKKRSHNGNCAQSNGIDKAVYSSNGGDSGLTSHSGLQNGSSESENTPVRLKRSGSVHVSAYLNLAANVMDNLLHGISIGGAYLLGLRVGALTTFAVLVHEVPHEISDFAILLRAGLSRGRAARLQIMTGCISLFGVLFAFLSAAGSRSAEPSSNSTHPSGTQSGNITQNELPWIVPFTIGAFVYISLTSVVPEIARIDEEVRKESGGSSFSSRWHGVLQLVSLGSGILLVHAATLLI